METNPGTYNIFTELYVCPVQMYCTRTQTSTTQQFHQTHHHTTLIQVCVKLVFNMSALRFQNYYMSVKLEFNTLLPIAREGNVFRGVCQSFCSRETGKPPPTSGGRTHPWRQTHPVLKSSGVVATVVVGTPLTGMHSCRNCYLS